MNVVVVSRVMEPHSAYMARQTLHTKPMSMGFDVLKQAAR
jgi:hypothetical protein